MKAFLLLFVSLLLSVTLDAQISLTANSGTATGSFTTLKGAFDAINAGTHKGVIAIKINASTSETASAVLNASAALSSGSPYYTSVTIYPTTTGLSITGNLAAPLINLNGADNVTIDGSVNQAGATKSLSITNTSASNTYSTETSTIRFINDASSNTVKYCTIKGSTLCDPSGILFFSTGATTGNDNNTIDHNDITNAADANRPYYAINSYGTSGKENSGNTISNNNIYDFLCRSASSNGIKLGLNTTSCTISGNSFYETTSFAPTYNGNYDVICIANSSGTGFTVSNNFIGGSSSSCGSTAWIKTSTNSNTFYGIYINAGLGTASSVQGNTIRNFDYSNSAAHEWYGIYISQGDVNIGTTTGNTIGATTGNGSITFSNTNNGGSFYGIYLPISGITNTQNNTIGSITVANANASNSTNFYGIWSYAYSSTTISNNIIGSTTTANSINASSASTSNSQTVYGICNWNTGAEAITISGNTISKLTNGTTNTNLQTSGLINGIYSGSGANTITNNTVRDLTIANAYEHNNYLASVGGIVLRNATPAQTITGNTIYNLSNRNSAFTGSVIGLNYWGGTTASVVKGNFIYNLSVNANTTSANIYGIKIAAGTTTYSNNIISIGGNTKTYICGIYESCQVDNNTGLYYNTVYIGGTQDAGSTNTSYALRNDSPANTRDFKNNIFVNVRSTPGGSSLHYAAMLSMSNLTLDYNGYYVSGTGGVLGYLNNTFIDVTSLPLISGGDVHSKDTNPLFASAGGTIAANYMPSASLLVAATGTGITTDYAGTSRSGSTPTMGAYEYAVSSSWTGGTNTDWNTTTNWNPGGVPTASNNVTISNVTNKPIVNHTGTSALCNNLTINSGAIVTIPLGKALTVNGTLTNNNAGGVVIQSDATGTGSLIAAAYSGSGTTAAQRYMTTGSWHLVSSPVVQAVTAFLSANNANVATNGSARGMMDYNPGTNQWNTFFTNTGSSLSLGAGKGFSLRVNTSVAVTATGALQAGTQPVSGLIQAKWNCIGNPYSSAIGITSSSSATANFLNVNTANLDPSFVAVYVWDNLDANNGQPGHYTAINNTNPPYSDIQQGQAFMVNMNASATSVSFTPAMQIHATTLLLKSSKLAWPTIKLVATVGGQTSSTVIAFNNSMNKGLDLGYDAGLLKGGFDLLVYTKLVQDNGIPFAIQALPDNDFSNMVIPVGLDFKTGGEVTFSSENLNLPSDCKVILEDKVTKTFTDLTKGVYKTTMAASTSIMDRFQLHTAGQVLDKVTDKLTAYAVRNTEIRVIGNVSKEAIATLFDIHGRIVVVKQLVEAGTNTIPLPGLKTGLYMLSVKDNGKQTSFKIMIKE